LPAGTQIQPGGIFSVGRISGPFISAFAGQVIHYGYDSVPQLRLIPGAAGHLPTEGRLGDLYMAATENQRGRLSCELYLCTRTGVTLSTPFAPPNPEWSRLQLGSPVIVSD
jgi:hypothetical protein